MDEKRYTRLEDKIDKIFNKTCIIETNMATFEEQVKANSKKIEILEKAVEPLKKHVSMMQGGLKLLSVVATCLVILGAFIRLIH